MRYQNRVDPWGRLTAVPGRDATRMGNRGRLHDENQQLIRQYREKRWIMCLLDVDGQKPRKGKVWGESYSELFFLDEATAYAAGHRPCWYCKREAYKKFCFAWRAANPDALLAGSRSVGDIDSCLHRERINIDGSKQTYVAPLASLPPGTFVEIKGQAYLRWGRGLHRWSFTGYKERIEIASAPVQVTVLTPSSVVRMLASCTYGMDVHESVAS